MNFFSIRKLPTGLFGLALPDCGADVLKFVLCEEVPFVWLLNCRSQALGNCVSAELKSLFPQAQNEVTVRCSAEFAFGLSTPDFLAELAQAALESDLRLASGRWYSIELIQAHRPLPRHFCPDAVSGRSRGRVFRTLDVHLQFSLPHADEWASVQACDPEPLEGVIRRVRPYFEAGRTRRFTAPPGVAAPIDGLRKPPTDA